MGRTIHKLLTFTTLLALLLASGSSFSQDKDTVSTEKKLKIIPLPALFYTPETRLGYGALVSGVFNLGDPENTRSSNVELLAAYTMNKQAIFRVNNTIFTKKEGYALSGAVNFSDFPILYYGIGNDTDEVFEEELEYKVIDIEERLLKQVKRSFFLGPQYRYSYLYDLSYEPDFLTGDKALLEGGQGTTSGLGFSTIYDTRDNVLNASTGSYLLFSSFFHGNTWGSDFDFNRYTIDLRRYWTLGNGDVIAGQYFGEFNTGNTPFREMSQLGGETIMRGYYNGRFRDNQQMAIQAEYRKQIIPWLGVVAFGSYGDVAEALSKFDPGAFKYTVGGGLRLMVNKADRLNIRIDYGIGKETSGFYFAIAEAF